MGATLLIMAAGMGSRYGGNKQVDGLGPNGEILMEYSIYDAIRAGFDKVVFVIKPGMKETLASICGDRIAKKVKVDYAFQDFSSVPSFYHIPEERTKPFGTVHAVLVARDYIDQPFAVINADDYYGVSAFSTIYEKLQTLAPEGEATMVGYQLQNTVSKNGTVSRGVCHAVNGNLDKVVETLKIKLCENGEIRDIGRAAGSPRAGQHELLGLHPVDFRQAGGIFCDVPQGACAGCDQGRVPAAGVCGQADARGRTDRADADDRRRVVWRDL